MRAYIAVDDMMENARFDIDVYTKESLEKRKRVRGDTITRTPSLGRRRYTSFTRHQHGPSL